MTRKPILLVEDDARLRDAMAETLRLAGFEVLEAADGTEALQRLASAPVAAVVTDYQMKPMDGSALLARIRDRLPRLPVLMTTAYGTIEHAVNSMLAGATDYLIKPYSPQALVEKLERLVPREMPAGGMVAEDPATLDAMGLATRVAQSDTTVLLCGESGTGKEVFARYIHQQSPRARGPFLAINCAAIPENMLEALLFGHEKGAFTGAHESRPGKFELAAGGTLLLDEISEMNLALQAKLLRVLQEREVERIGGRQPVKLNVRVVATTNQDLRTMVREGRFREDLYYRLSVFPISLPPLRQRPADILPLLRHYIVESTPRGTPVPAVSQEALQDLLAYSWPGNVRELSNVVQRAVILCGGQPIQRQHLRFEPAPAAPATTPPSQASAAVAADACLQDSLLNVEGRLIVEAIQRSGSRKRAAEILGISPRTLRYKLARLRDSGLPVPGREASALAAHG